MNKRPPKYTLKFFRWFCHPDYREDIEGDLNERFDQKPSKWNFALEVMKLLRPEIIRPITGTKKLNYYGMLKHYLLITFRSFKKEKSYTVINLFGLILSISVSLLIWQYINAEKSVDSFHSNVANKFRVNYSFFQGGALKRTESMTHNGLGPEVEKSLAGVKNMVRVRPMFADEGVILSHKSENVFSYGAYYVEDSFLDFFNYPLETGIAGEALSKPNSIVLSKEAAIRHFGDENPMGKTIHISGGALTGDFIVTGVLKKTAKRSHFDFEYLIPLEYMLEHYGIYTRHNEWHWSNFYTFLELETGTSQKGFAGLVDDIIKGNIGEDLASRDETLKSSFQPISNIYLDRALVGDSGLFKGNALNLQIFSIVAIVVLLVASINYINLASARAIKKKDEVSLKKAIGANEPQLIVQFLFESLLLNIFSFGVSLIVCYLISTNLHSLIGIEMDFLLIQNQEFWMIALLALLAISLLTGMYPALLSIKLGSLRLSKSQMLTTSKGSLIRKSLMGFQLLSSLSSSMVVGTS